MKIRHTLIASALLTALSAQAQTSITVYGNADIAYNNLVTTASTGIKTEENNIVAGVAHHVPCFPSGNGNTPPLLCLPLSLLLLLTS